MPTRRKSPDVQAADRAAGMILRECREKAGLTRHDVAARMYARGITGMNETTLHRLEAGERSLTIPEAAGLADVLGITLEQWDDVMGKK